MRSILARIGCAIGYAAFAGVILALGLLTIALCAAGSLDRAYLAAIAFLLCVGLALAALARRPAPRGQR